MLFSISAIHSSAILATADHKQIWFEIHNMPILNNGLRTGTYTALNAISHNV